MLKQRSRLITSVVFLVDLTMIAVAFVLAWLIRSVLLPYLLPAVFPSRLYPLEVYLPLLPLACAVWGILLLFSDSYRSHRTVPLVEEGWEIIRICVSAAVVFTLLIYVLRLDERLLGDDLISRSWIFLFALFSCLLLLNEKVALRVTSRYVRARGYNYRTVLIVGTGATARAFADSIRSHRWWGFRILGFVSTGDAGDDPLVAEDEILGEIRDIPHLVETHPVDDVIFAVRRHELERLDELFLVLQEQGIRTRFALDLFAYERGKIELEELDGLPILSYSPTPSNPLLLMQKRVLDVLVSLLLLLLGLPVVFVVALVIKLSSGGSILYRQTRCGLNGRLFTLYKFRTMVEDAEARREELLHLNEMTGPAFKLKSDPRVTRVGRFLRKFSLDELPQLLNVLRGDMSLVGPRPPIPEEVAKYQRWQRRRLSMKPGLTCLWQISGRNNLDFNRWIELDLEYIDTWSPLLDMKILLKTIPVVLTGRGAS